MGGGTSLRHDEHAGTATARDDGCEPQRSGAVRRAAARAGTRRATPLECWFGLLVTAAAFSTASAALVSRWNLGALGQNCDQVCPAVGGVCDVARLNVTQAESHSAALGPRAYRQLLAQNQNDIAIYRHALDRLLTETAPVEVRLIA